MNTIRIFTVIFIFTLSFGLIPHWQVNARRDRSVQARESDRAEKLQNAQNEADRVRNEAQEQIAQLEIHLQKKIERLHAKAAKESADMGQRDEMKALKILHKADEHEDHLRQEAEKSKEHITKEVEQRAKHILKSATKELKMKPPVFATEKEEAPAPMQPTAQQPMQQPVQQESSLPTVLLTGQKTPVSSDWKTEVSQIFGGNINYLKTIILEGETDPKEQQDFDQLFGSQQQWFDTTVSNTTFFFDPSYNAVMKKQQAVDELSQAQERADSLIVQLAAPTVLPDDIHKRLRVVVLYEINAAYRKMEEAQQGKMSDVQIEEIVKKVLVQSHLIEALPLQAPKQTPAPFIVPQPAMSPAETPAMVSMPQPMPQPMGQAMVSPTSAAPVSMVQPMPMAQTEPKASIVVNKEETVQFLKERLAQLQNELKEEREKIGKIVEKKNEEALNIQIQLKKAQQSVDSLTKRIQKSSEEFERIKGELANTKKHQVGTAEKLKSLLEESNKKQISLQLMLDRAQSKVNALKQKLGVNEEKFSKLKTDYQKDIEKQREQGARLEITVSTARQEIAQLKQRIEMISQHREDAQQKAVEAYAQVKNLTAQNQKLTGTKTEEKRKRRNQIDLALAKLAEQNENFRQVMQSQKAEVAQLRSQIEMEIDSLGSQVNSQIAQLADQEQQGLMNIRQEQEVANAENVQGMQESLTMLAQRLVNDADQGQEGLIRMRQEQAATNNENIEGMQESLMFLAQQLAKYEQTAADYQRKQVSMQSVIDKTKNTMNSLQDMVGKTDEKLGQLEVRYKNDLENAFNNTRQEIEDAKQKIEMLVAQRVEADVSQKTEVEQLRTQIQTASDSLEQSFQDQMTQLQAHEAKERNKEKDELIEAQQETKNTLQQELKNLASQLAKHEQETTEIINKQGSLQRTVERAESTVTALQQKTVANDEKIAGLQLNQKYNNEKQREQGSRFQDALNNARDEATELRHKIETLTQESNAAQQKALQALEQVKALSEHNEAMSAQKDEDVAQKMQRDADFKQACSVLMQQNEQFKQIAQSQKGEIEQLRSQIASKMTDLENRFNQENKALATKENQDIQKVEQEEHMVAQQEAKKVLQHELRDLAHDLAQHAIDTSEFQEEMIQHQNVYEQLSKDMEKEAESLMHDEMEQQAPMVTGQQKQLAYEEVDEFTGIREEPLSSDLTESEIVTIDSEEAIENQRKMDKKAKKAAKRAEKLKRKEERKKRKHSND